MERRITLRVAAYSALLCTLAFGVAIGQEPPPLPPGKGPGAQPELRRIAFLMGQWEEDITYAGREGDAAMGRGRWMARPAMGRFLMFNYEGEGPEGRYAAHGVLSFHAESQNYRMWWFDSSGGEAEYRGTLADEGTLVLEHRGTAEGKPFRERITYTRASPFEVRTRIEQAYGDEEYKLYLEAVARRMRAPAGPRRMNRPPVP
jgi:hypothetical protein